jgi:spermidine/putrescine transport system substrate-binding protein
MKKIFRVLAFGAFIAVMGLVLASCGSRPTINVYNWGDYIDPDIIRIFEQETGIRVRYSTYSRNEELYTRIARGGSGYDVVFPSDHMISKMIREDLLERLDFANIPNYINVDARFMGLDYDPDNLYSVPYLWGTMGILYNTTMVHQDVDSWNILWDTNFARQIFMYESMRDIIAVGQRRLGFSVNDTNLANLYLVRDSLIEQKPLVQAYLDENIRDKMIGREGALAMVYSGDAMYCIEENDELAYIVPKEGSIVWFDAMVIPKGARNKAHAEAFINFMLRPDIALMNTLYVGYSTTNYEAFKLLSAEWQNDPVYWPCDDVLARCEVLLDLGDFTREYDRIWTQVLAAR